MNRAPTDIERRGRRSVRLQGHDYAAGGAYFVTICAHERACIFGNVIDGTAVSSERGIVVRDEWLAIATHDTRVRTDAFVVMPNHLHGIILLRSVGARYIAPDHDEANPDRLDPNSLGEVVRAFKARVTHAIHTRYEANIRVWQRNYHEHIIRNDDEMQRIRRYITNNAREWQRDHENPGHVNPSPNEPWEP